MARLTNELDMRDLSRLIGFVLVTWSLGLKVCGQTVLSGAVQSMPGEFRFSWNSAASNFYQVESAVSLPPDFCGKSPLLFGTNGLLAFACPIIGSHELFRIRNVDRDAAAYVLRAGVTNQEAIRRVDGWFTGLKTLGIYTNVVWMTALRSEQTRLSDGILQSMIGSNATVLGTAPVSVDEGLVFSGLERLEFQNPLRTNALSALSIFAVAQAQSAGGAICGGLGAGGSGPLLSIGISPFQGGNSNNCYFDFTHDGVNPTPTYNVGGHATHSWQNSGLRTAVLSTFCLTNFSIQANIETRSEAGFSSPPLWNDVPNWNIGSMPGGGLDYHGTISFVCVFKTALTTEQYNALRLLYYRTLSLNMKWPEVSAIYEGDSLTEISSVTTFSQLLNRRSHWSGHTNKRNVAKGGENIQQMLAEYENEVQPYATEPGRRYLFLWAGRNNLGPAVSAPNLHTLIKSYWRRARADGFKVVAFTAIPAGPDDSTGTTPVRQQLNALIRADQGLEYDYLIDLAGLPEFQNPFDLNYFSPDTVHITALAHERIADWINGTITEP